MKLEEHTYKEQYETALVSEEQEIVSLSAYLKFCSDIRIENIDGDDITIDLTIPDLELLLEAVTKTLAAAKAFKEEQ